MRKIIISGMLLLSALAAQAASAAEVTVEMLSFDKDTKTNNLFKPGLVKIAKGDTVKWIAKQAGHNVAFVPNAVPAGVPAFNSPMGKDVTFKMRDMALPFTAESFVLSFSLPNLHFHATTAYAIMRHNGLPIGKRQFFGPM
jgi:plastocyanin